MYKVYLSPTQVILVSLPAIQILPTVYYYGQQISEKNYTQFLQRKKE